MKKIFPLLLLVIFSGCNNTVTEKEAASKNSNTTQNESPANASAEKLATIKILKDDKLVVEYKALFPQGGITTYKTGEKDIVLKLSNDNNTYNLIATLEKPTSGKYSIGKPGLGQASLQLTTEGKGGVPFMTNLTEGTFKITLTGETCSGNFSGSQIEAGLDNIKIIGEFTSIPLMKQTSNY